MSIMTIAIIVVVLVCTFSLLKFTRTNGYATPWRAIVIAYLIIGGAYLFQNVIELQKKVDNYEKVNEELKVNGRTYSHMPTNTMPKKGIKEGVKGQFIESLIPFNGKEIIKQETHKRDALDKEAVDLINKIMEN